MEIQSANLTWGTPLVFLFLILCFVNSPAPAQENSKAWINEIHYDNVGDDAGEAIEIVVEAENFPGFDISLMRITLYNGNGGKKYKDVKMAESYLGDFIAPFSIYSIEISSIQNGDPDGIALSYNDQLIQFISYGGSFTAMNGVAEGETAEDIGVSESSPPPIGYSLQLGGSGDQYKTFSWNNAAPETFGSENNGQSLLVINEPQPVSNFKFDKIAPDKVAISWGKPIGIHEEDWDGVLVFASDDGPNEVVLEGKDYKDFSGGGQVFGNGTKILNSNTVVRQQTDENGEYVITNLKPSQDYHFVAYTYLKIAGSENDMFSNPSEEIDVLTKAEDVTLFQCVPLSQKARFSWKNSMGEKGKWWHEILMVASENPVSFTPDQKTFSADKTFGDGESPVSGEFIVYQGMDSVAFVEGLENGKEYYFKTFVRYDVAEGFYWSSGAITTCEPSDNVKTWTGNAGNNLFTNANNWQPAGVPEGSHDVVLDSTYVKSAYEVLYLGSTDLEINSITISPQDASRTITLLLKSEADSKIKLTLHDDISPLNVSNYGVLINEMKSLNAAIQTPNGKIILAEKAKYTHKTKSKHAAILDNIALENETIPGTIEFNITASVSISGRSFSSLNFSSESPATFSALGSSPITIKENLLIGEGVTLNLGDFPAPLNIEGDLQIDGTFNFNNVICFKGNKNQTLSGLDRSQIQLGSILVDKSSNALSLGSNLEVTKRLELRSGIIETDENRLILDFTSVSNLEATAGTGKIQGNLEVIRNVSKQETAFEYAGVTFKEGPEDLGPVTIIRNTGTAIENGASKSINRNWTINATSAMISSRSVAFKWDETEEGEYFDPNNVQLWQESADETAWTAVGEVQDGSSRSITAAIERFSRFTIADIENPLPINLLSFEVVQLNNQALLSWSTFGELNNEGFEIQKSIDQKSFSKIGFVRGNNTTLQKIDYEFKDQSFEQNAYYRLRQIDYDGTSSFSPIRYLSRAFRNTKLKISPNPVKLPISIHFANDDIESERLIEYCYLYSSLGVRIFEARNYQKNDLEIEFNKIMPNLHSGLYILTLSLEGQIQKIKIIKE